MDLRWMMALAGALASAAAAGGGLSSEEVTWINRFADDMVVRCEQRYDQVPADARPRAQALFALERRINCECLPTRVRVRATPAVVDALKRRDVTEARRFMLEQARVCGVQGLRDSAHDVCVEREQLRLFEAEQGRAPTAEDAAALAAIPPAVETTCACYAQAVAGLEDQVLIDAAETPPDTADGEGVLARLMAGCRP